MRKMLLLEIETFEKKHEQSIKIPPQVLTVKITGDE